MAAAVIDRGGDHHRPLPARRGALGVVAIGLAERTGARLKRTTLVLDGVEPGLHVDLLDRKTVDVLGAHFVQRHLDRRHVTDEEAAQFAPDFDDRLRALARPDRRNQGQPGVAIDADAPVGLRELALEGGFQVFEDKLGLLVPLGAQANDQSIELEQEGVPRRIDMGLTQALDDLDRILTLQDERLTPAGRIRGLNYHLGLCGLHYGFGHILPCTGNDSSPNLTSPG